MSNEAITAVGDEIDCKVCGKHLIAEFAYEMEGVCGACVKRLAHKYAMAHSGQPVFGFSTAEQLAEYAGRPRTTYRKEPISASLRRKVFERDGYRCRKCGSHIDLHADHIHPESKGGPTALDNLQTLCGPCNIAKGAKIE